MNQATDSDYDTLIPMISRLGVLEFLRVVLECIDGVAIEKMPDPLPHASEAEAAICKLVAELEKGA